MSRSKVIVGIVAVGLLGVMVWKLWPVTVPDAPAPVVPGAGVQPPVEAQSSPGGITLLPIAADMARLNASDALPQDDLSLVDLLLITYRKQQGSNPTGENEEITAALLGKNPKHLAYLPAKAPFLNAAGQLVDRWGTPYFFHSMSAARTDIRSAGPDREMWTDDDIEFSP